MKDGDLFQLGIGLDTGAQEEDKPRDPSAAHQRWNNPKCKDHFIRKGNAAAYAGTHLIIDVVAGKGLDDPARIEQAFRDCVDACGATLVHIHTHKFSPQGVSGVAVLAESHISVHTWPEIGYGAFDVFMCGSADPWRAVDVLARAFATDDVRVRELRRGVGVVSDRV